MAVGQFRSCAYFVYRRARCPNNTKENQAYVVALFFFMPFSFCRCCRAYADCLFAAALFPVVMGSIVFAISVAELSRRILATTPKYDD